MDEGKQTVATAAQVKRIDSGFGAVVGWERQDLGDRIVLTVQSTRSPDAAEVDEFRYFLTRQQAMVLGNYLCKASGLTIPPPRRRGLLSWMRRGD